MIELTVYERVVSYCNLLFRYVCVLGIYNCGLMIAIDPNQNVRR